MESADPSQLDPARLTIGGRWVSEPVYPSPAPPLPKGRGLTRAIPKRYRHWSVETGERVATLPADERAWDGLDHDNVRFSPDDRGAIVSTYPTPRTVEPGRPEPVTVTLRRYDPATGREVWNWELPGAVTVRRPTRFLGPLLWLTIEFAPDSGRLAVVRNEDDGSVRVWVLDSANGSVLRELRAPAANTPPGPAGDKWFYSAVAFGPSSRLAVGTGRDVVVWDGTSPEGRRLSGHDQVVSAATYSADGRRLFTLDGYPGTTPRVVRVWDLTTGRELLVIREPNAASVTLGTGYDEQMWLDGDRLMLITPGGVLAFDGTPRTHGPRGP